VAQHECEEGHHITWNEAKSLQIELSNACRKYKQSTYRACMTYLISQSIQAISPIWIPFISKEVGRLQDNYQVGWSYDDVQDSYSGGDQAIPS
jgi:hypothetical protein